MDKSEHHDSKKKKMRSKIAVLFKCFSLARTKPFFVCRFNFPLMNKILTEWLRTEDLRDLSVIDAKMYNVWNHLNKIALKSRNFERSHVTLKSVEFLRWHRYPWLLWKNIFIWIRCLFFIFKKALAGVRRYWFIFNKSRDLLPLC